VCAALLSVLVFRFMAREAGARAAFCLLLITLATPLLVVGSVLMTIDPPLVLCWTWAVVAGWRAAQPGAKTRDWAVVGLALGLGFLCKYTAGFQLICWVIFFALQPSARGQLRKAGPWLGLLIFLVCALPVIIWNSQHDWITASDLTGDAGLHGDWHPTLNYFFEFTGAEFGLLNPVFLVASLWAAVAAWRWRARRPLWLFLGCMSAPGFFGHWLYSFHSRVQPNWIAAAVPVMFCLMVLYWNERRTGSPAGGLAEFSSRASPAEPPVPGVPGANRWVKFWLAAGVSLGVVASVFMYSTDLIGRIAGSKLPGDVDFSHRLRGWRETAQLVETERVQFDRNAFILADHYGPTGLYSFYSAPARAATGENWKT